MEELSPLDQAFHLKEQGEELFYQGKATEAARLLKKAYGTFKEIGSTEDAVVTLGLAGLAHALEGGNHAKICFKNALQLASDRGESHLEAAVWCDMAVMQRWRGHPEYAKQYLQHSFLLANQPAPEYSSGDTPSPRIMSEYGRTLIDVGAPHEHIKQQLDEAVLLARMQGDGRLEAATLSYLGALEIRYGDAAQATTFLYGALGVLQTHFPDNNAYQESIALGLLSRAHPNQDVMHTLKDTAEEFIARQPPATQIIMRREAMLQ